MYSHTIYSYSTIQKFHLCSWTHYRVVLVAIQGVFLEDDNGWKMLRQSFGPLCHCCTTRSITVLSHQLLIHLLRRTWKIAFCIYFLFVMLVLSDIAFFVLFWETPVSLAQHHLKSILVLNVIVTEMHHIESSVANALCFCSKMTSERVLHSIYRVVFYFLMWVGLQYGLWQKKKKKNLSIRFLRTGNGPKTTFSSKLEHCWGTASCLLQGVELDVSPCKFVKLKQ